YYKSFDNIQYQLKACEQLTFAMNGGMFHSGFSPVGLYIEKKLRDQAKMNIPTYQFLREKAEKRNIDPTSPLVFIEPDKKETI
ncbi:hypothetical protein ACFMKF_18320, partial [Acinetobacter baumannii]